MSAALRIVGLVLLFVAAVFIAGHITSLIVH